MSVPPSSGADILACPTANQCRLPLEWECRPVIAGEGTCSSFPPQRAGVSRWFRGGKRPGSGQVVMMAAVLRTCSKFSIHGTSSVVGSIELNQGQAEISQGDQGSTAANYLAAATNGTLPFLQRCEGELLLPTLTLWICGGWEDRRDNLLTGLDTLHFPRPRIVGESTLVMALDWRITHIAGSCQRSVHSVAPGSHVLPARSSSLAD